MDILQIVTTGLTGMTFAILASFMFINLIKAGYLGGLSRWVSKVADHKDRYGGRILFLNIAFAIVINLVQYYASAETLNFGMLILKIVGCSFLASGGYEYAKTIARNLPSFKEGE